MQLKNFDVDAFLANYWQQKPVLIPNPWKVWKNPIGPDELAGLACEEEVESRLIVKNEADLTLEHGPFEEVRFGNLGAAPWTLLVQAVDHYVNDVAGLLEPFRFIPNWRIDDIMVSYASDGGGVGAHFDQYDVFLIQGLGKRRWQIGGHCNQDTALLPHSDLRLLADFKVTDEWVLEPGDILYVPPGFSHNGVAVGDDCMTYSIGFRAPSRYELIGHYVDDLLSKTDQDDRYSDAGLSVQSNPGEISATALERLHILILEKLSDQDAFVSWFGQYNSTPKYPDIDWRPEEPATLNFVKSSIAMGAILTRNPASRFAYVEKSEGKLLLFADGASFVCSDGLCDFARALCSQTSVAIKSKNWGGKSLSDLILNLLNQGSVSFD
jgi:50S ribosomal protein L16 3-hydroxylase